MHPLRFPNNSIRAKQRQRGKRVVGHSQASYKGGQPQPGHPQGGGRLWLGPARKGGRRRLQVEALVIRVIACRQQGKRHQQGLLPATSRGSARTRPVRKGVAPVGVPPSGAEPTAGAVASVQGSCCVRRGSNDGDNAVRVMEGLGHPFKKRMILPVRI
ncbi:hypothetical protein BHE74_00026282 [Ensete ventricosum]|nr:hypothetical protein GW17_00045937 [Ensete ventricosum]RWW66351.1 hypothetical protein BHE74_00026282 [Ensete ventricosum]